MRYWFVTKIFLYSKWLIFTLLICTIAPLSAQNSDGVPCPGLPSVADVDGNLYATVQIGSQCWMKENVRTLHYADGQPISVSSSQQSYRDPVCYRMPDSGAEEEILYNWTAATRGLHSESAPSHVQGVCPSGWHIPSAAEWNALLDYLRQNPMCRENGNPLSIGKALAATENWLASPDSACIGNRPNLNNLTGFSATPTGDFAGSFRARGTLASFWSASVNDFGGADYLCLCSYTPYAILNAYHQCDGRSVRCLRNVGQDAALPTTSPTPQNHQDGTPCPGTDSIRDVDSNVYHTVQIGQQCWMRENLRVTHTPAGVEIVLAKEKNGFKPYRYAPCDSLSYVPTYGFLYNWCAAMNGEKQSRNNPSGVQGICPDGWHLPSIAEWHELTDYVRSLPQFGQKDAADRALAAPAGWTASSYLAQSATTSDSVRSVGLDVLPAGLYEEFYDGFGEDAYFWSASAMSKTLSFFFGIGNSVRAVDQFYYYCGDGFSVRCVRN